jgi:uncharacterized membrane protein
MDGFALARLTTRRVVYIAAVAALYAVLTVGIAPLSYGPLQFRVSEVLKVMVLFDPWLVLGIGFGTLLANSISPFVGPWELVWMPLTDMLGGLLAWAIYRLLRRRWAAIPMSIYALTTGLAVGTMLFVFQLGGFWLLSAAVAVSELLILIGGIPLVFGIRRILEQRGIHL